MCQLALADLPGHIAAKVQINPIEILRTGPSYAIDTVEAVAQTYPEDTIVFNCWPGCSRKIRSMASNR